MKKIKKEELYLEIMRAIELIEEDCPNMAKEILLSLANEISFIELAKYIKPEQY